MSLNRPAAMEHFDRSGIIDGGESQVIFARNNGRIGLTLQNQGANPMWLLVIQGDPNVKPTRYKIDPDKSFYWDQFAPLNEMHIQGTVGEPFAASEFGL